MKVGTKSLPMLYRFQSISQNILWRRSGIWKDKNRNCYFATVNVKEHRKFFENADIKFGDPPKPPFWVKINNIYFGAYLAGVIDGDGNVRLRRPRYPQLVIRIYSGKYPTHLLLYIKNILKCGAAISYRKRESTLNNRVIRGGCYILEFVVSKKNLDFFKNFVLPYLSIEHKKDKLHSFIKLNGEVV